MHTKLASPRLARNQPDEGVAGPEAANPVFCDVIIKSLVGVPGYVHGAQQLNIVAVLIVECLNMLLL